MVIKIVEKLNVEVSVRNWSVELLEFAIANILNDGFKDLELKYIFNDDKKNMILVSKINDIGWWISIAKKYRGRYINI